MSVHATTRNESRPDQEGRSVLSGWHGIQVRSPSQAPRRPSANAVCDLFSLPAPPQATPAAPRTSRFGVYSAPSTLPDRLVRSD